MNEWISHFKNYPAWYWLFRIATSRWNSTWKRVQLVKEHGSKLRLRLRSRSPPFHIDLHISVTVLVRRIFQNIKKNMLNKNNKKLVNKIFRGCLAELTWDDSGVSAISHYLGDDSVRVNQISHISRLVDLFRVDLEPSRNGLVRSGDDSTESETLNHERTWLSQFHHSEFWHCYQKSTIGGDMTKTRPSMTKYFKVYHKQHSTIQSLAIKV